MTPEEIEGIKKLKQIADDSPGCPEFVIETDDLVFLCDSALRLAAIEAAGDEEVGLYYSHGMEYSNGDPVVEEALAHLRDIAKSRNATIADLRAKLGEATELLHMIYSKPMCDEMLDYDEGKRLFKFIAESEVGGGL